MYIEVATVRDDAHILRYNFGVLKLNDQDLQLRGPYHPYKKLLDIVGILFLMSL